MLIVTRPVHASKALLPKVLTLVGIVTVVIEHDWKALLPIDVTEAEMTMSPLQHKPPWEVLSTQPVVVDSGDILLLVEATVIADAVPSSCSTIFSLTVLLCLPLSEDSEAETDAETETEAEAEVALTGKRQMTRSTRRRKSSARPFRVGLLEMQPLRQ